MHNDTKKNVSSEYKELPGCEFESTGIKNKIKRFVNISMRQYQAEKYFKNLFPPDND